MYNKHMQKITVVLCSLVLDSNAYYVSIIYNNNR